MSLQKEQELDAQYIIQTYARKPVEFVRGAGMCLYDENGKEHLDFLSGIGAVSIGHCHPTLVAAIQEQAQKLIHPSNYFYIEGRGELAQKISNLIASADGARTSGVAGSVGDADAAGAYAAGADGAGADKAAIYKTFFANSGAEANEGAIKLARLYAKKCGKGATTIISMNNSFHGRTLATLAATGQDFKQEPFNPLPEGFISVDLNDINALESAFSSKENGEICAVLMEPVQGESGVWPATAKYVQAVRAACDKAGALLIFDEVQSGFFRCGTYPFAYQHFGVSADIVTMAKGLGGGFPVGAFAAKAHIADVFGVGLHGSTFGGSALAMAAANATIDVLLDEEIGANSEEVGAYLREELAKLDEIAEVRGKGLMVGATLKDGLPTAGEIVDAALPYGLIINAIGAKTVRFLPPLVCTKEDIDKMLQCLKGAINDANK